MAYLISVTDQGDLEYDGTDLINVVDEYNAQYGTSYDADDFGWVTSCEYSVFNNLEVAGESLERTLEILELIEKDAEYAAKLAYLMEEDSVDMWDAWRLLEDGNSPDWFEGDAEAYAQDQVDLPVDQQEFFNYYAYGQYMLRCDTWKEFDFDGTTYTIGDE